MAHVHKRVYTAPLQRLTLKLRQDGSLCVASFLSTLFPSSRDFPESGLATNYVFTDVVLKLHVLESCRALTCLAYQQPQIILLLRDWVIATDVTPILSLPCDMNADIHSTP